MIFHHLKFWVFSSPTMKIFSNTYSKKNLLLPFKKYVECFFMKKLTWYFRWRNYYVSGSSFICIWQCSTFWLCLWSCMLDKLLKSCCGWFAIGCTYCTCSVWYRVWQMNSIPESNDSSNYKSKEGKLGIKTDIIVFNS